MELCHAEIGVQQQEYGHGRHEYRSYLVFYDLDKIRDRGEWAGLKAVGVCYRENTEGEAASEEWRCFIGSKKARARYYSKGLRNHWRGEDKLDLQLDVTFAEDDSRVQGRNASQNLAVLRRVA